MLILAGSSTPSPWASVISVLDTSSMLKISQQQFTFIMRLVDELGLFFDVLERNKLQSVLIKQQLKRTSPSSDVPSNDIKITFCLLSPAIFTLAVMDGLENAILNLVPPAPPSNLSEVDLEFIRSNSYSTTDSMTTKPMTTTVHPSSSTTGLGSSLSSIEMNEENKNSSYNLSRSLNLSGQKKNKMEEIIQRGLEVTSKGSRGSSQTSLVNMADSSDDSSSQWDQLSEDLDADLDPALLNSDYEQQQQQQEQHKAARIEIDDDSMSSTEKNPMNNIVIGTNALEAVSLLF